MNPIIQSHLRKPPLWMYFAAYVIPYLLLAAIALYWPAHSSPLGLDFTQSKLARMVPSISAYIDKSAFPHAMAAYFVLSGVLGLPFSILTAMHPVLLAGSSKIAINGYMKYKEKRFIGWMATFTAIPILIWGSWIQPGYQFGIVPIIEKRLALAFSGFWFSFYFMTYILISAVCGRLYFEKLFQLERKHHGME